MAETIKIHLFTGKGGVGKSTVAAAFALKQKMLNPKSRVLLAELGPQSFYTYYFKTDQKVDSTPQPTSLGFDVARWSGDSCLKEYALYLLKIQKLYQIFFENPVAKVLLDIAPGLTELAITGKITSGPPRNVGPKLNYDILIVDSFSTGHFLSLLRAPLAMRDAIRVGPIHEQSKKILEVLGNPLQTRLHIVSLPEALPIEESIELANSIKTLLPKQFPRFWLNKIIEFPQSFNDEPKGILPLLESKKNRQISEIKKFETHFAELKKSSLTEGYQKLPYCLKSDEIELVQNLAREIE